MDCITISDLEVQYRVGVPEAERAQPQRLLITVVMEQDCALAASTDELANTIDYYAVAQRLLLFSDDCHWELIETVAADIAAMVIEDFQAKRVTVEVKKFILPQARYVSVRLTRPSALRGA